MRQGCESTDGVAFYIHHVVSKMKFHGNEASIGLAKEIISKALIDAHDPWHLHHYRNRLDEYFPKDSLSIVLAILDTIALETEALSFLSLKRHLNASFMATNDETTTKKKSFQETRSCFTAYCCNYNATTTSKGMKGMVPICFNFHSLSGGGAYQGDCHEQWNLNFPIYPKPPQPRNAGRDFCTATPFGRTTSRAS